jgi:hypothetical protein
MQDIKDTHVLFNMFMTEVPIETKFVMQKNEENVIVGQSLLFTGSKFHKPIVLPNRCYKVTLVSYNSHHRDDSTVTFKYDDDNTSDITIPVSHITRDSIQNYSLYIKKEEYEDIKNKREEMNNRRVYTAKEIDDNNEFVERHYYSGGGARKQKSKKRTTRRRRVFGKKSRRRIRKSRR